MNDTTGTDTPAARGLWPRLNRTATVAAVLIAALLLLSLSSVLGLLPYDSIAQQPSSRLQAPSGTHWLGTDQFGRDVLARTAAGLANSALIAAVAVAFAGTVGVAAGLVAGFYRGFGDTVISGVANVLFAFPPLLLALSLVAVFERHWFTVAVAIAVVYVPIFARVVRGPVLSLREVEFVTAAVATGQHRLAIMVRHVLPNIAPLVIVQVTLSLSWAVLTEASLSFLGLGTAPPAASLGLMIMDSRSLLPVAPWTMVAPGLAVVALVVGLNVLGDALRGVLDPRGEARRSA